MLRKDSSSWVFWILGLITLLYALFRVVFIDKVPVVLNTFDYFR